MSKSLSNILTCMVKAPLVLLKPKRRDIVQAIVSQQLIPQTNVKTPFGSLKFQSPNRQSLEYPRDILVREPDTISWISNFKENDVFWDIGANVGAYSLFAALVTKAPVLAFEPSASTFAALIKNVEINALDDLVRPYCLALSDKTVLDSLNMPHTYASSVSNVFGGEKNCIDELIDVAFRQSVPGFRLDDFCKIFDPPAPNHIKIDVDSIEPEILAGGPKLLSTKELISVLVEVETDSASPRTQKILKTLENAGLKPIVSKSDNHSHNIIFHRT